MTKKEEKLVWRLKEQPTSENLTLLVDKGILKENEARQILFSKEEIDEKSLKEEIKFLRNLVEKLSNNNRTTIVEKIREVEKPVYREFEWYKPYYIYGNGTWNVNDSGSVVCTSDSPVMDYSIQGNETFTDFINKIN